VFLTNNPGEASGASPGKILSRKLQSALDPRFKVVRLTQVLRRSASWPSVVLLASREDRNAECEPRRYFERPVWPEPMAGNGQDEPLLFSGIEPASTNAAHHSKPGRYHGAMRNLLEESHLHFQGAGSKYSARADDVDAQNSPRVPPSGAEEGPGDWRILVDFVVASTALCPRMIERGAAVHIDPGQDFSNAVGLAYAYKSKARGPTRLVTFRIPELKEGLGKSGKGRQSSRTNSDLLDKLSSFHASPPVN